MAKLDAKAQPPLIQAILAEDVARLKRLLADGADPNTAATDGRCALDVAENEQELQVALIDAGADVGRAARKHMNPVWAVGTGRADVLQKVIDAGGDVNCHTFSGTPVHVAARSGHADMVRLLIERGADVNAGTSVGNPLADAVEKGHVECALLLLKAGAKPEMIKYDRRTLLTLAAHKRQPEVAEALLAAGAKPDARGTITVMDPQTYAISEPYGTTTPLMIAARLGEVRIIDALLKAGAKPATRDEDGNRPLDLARQNGHADAAARIAAALGSAADETDPNEDLLLAAERGDAAKVRKLLTAGGCKVNTRDRRARSKDATPLLLAVRNGHREVAEALLDAKADPDLHDATNAKDAKAAAAIGRECDEATLAEMGVRLGRTALAEAAARGNEPLAALLLARNATVGAADVLGQTPLHLAAAAGSAAVVRLLLERGADANAKDAGKRPVLEAAVDSNDADTVGALLAAGAKLSGKSAGSALCTAAGAGAAGVVRALLKSGVKVDAGGWNNRTALFAAAGKGRADVIRVLLEAGADVNHREKDGGSALHEASRNPDGVKVWKDGVEVVRYSATPEQMLEAARVLLDAGADPNAADGNKFTPLSWAAISENVPMARLLIERGANPNRAAIFDQPLVERVRGGDAPAALKELIKRAAAAASMPAAGAAAVAAPKPKAATSPKPRRGTRKAPAGAEDADADADAPPDFAAALDRKDYQRLVAAIEKQCGTKRVGFEHAPGAFHFHVDSRSKFDFARARKDAAAAGCTLVWLDPLQKQQVGLFPTADPLEALLALGTNGANYDLGPADVVAWLRALHAEQPFEITAANFDTVEGRFLNDVANPRQLARRMYKFCPDLVDQGVGSVAALAKSLQENRELYFWWD